MRVAHVITRMIIGGAQENTLFNCQDLVEHFDDQVLLITGPSTGPEGSLLERAGLLDPTAARPISDKSSAGGAGGLKLQLIDNLQRAIHPVCDWRAYQDLLAALRSFQPDVVHTHSAKGGFLGRAAGWKIGAPVVVHTVHGAPFHPYQSFLARRFFIQLERWAARRCHHLISVANAMTDLMVEARVAPRDKFTTIFSGMDVEPFQQCGQYRDQARKKFGFQPDDIVFGKIARLFHLKGHSYLIEAAQLAVRDNPRCKFLLVGDGLLRQQCELAIRAAGLERHFVFAGLVPPDEVPFCLSAMDVLVHTSLREGLARTLPQALIAGKPVVSYDVDGAREVALPDETGFLLPPKSISELAQAILSLAASAELRHRLGQGGAQRFTDQFRHQHMTQRIRQLYTQLGAS